ncbi:hypothetical protein BDN70DRAFT_901397 [Pholiota conissans]|uniref:Uncharacterized protein n=1 Tax=Pholiota conissans TaxID=109636 RepID=A0A9P6CSS5_9AGAR|nr:hypothetical protein BDN70DRAFT_901397 [Pholiota conissans]
MAVPITTRSCCSIGAICNADIANVDHCEDGASQQKMHKSGGQCQRTYRRMVQGGQEPVDIAVWRVGAGGWADDNGGNSTGQDQWPRAGRLGGGDGDEVATRC